MHETWLRDHPPASVSGEHELRARGECETTLNRQRAGPAGRHTQAGERHPTSTSRERASGECEAGLSERAGARGYGGAGGRGGALVMGRRERNPRLRARPPRIDGMRASGAASPKGAPLRIDGV